MNKNIILCGVGGQGTVLASRLISSAVFSGWSGSKRLKEASLYRPFLYTRTTVPRSVVIVSLDTDLARWEMRTANPTESADRTLT